MVLRRASKRRRFAAGERRSGPPPAFLLSWGARRHLSSLRLNGVNSLRCLAHALPEKRPHRVFYLVGWGREEPEMRNTLEAPFDDAMMKEVYQRARNECGYNATRFLQMLYEYRGL